MLILFPSRHSSYKLESLPVKPITHVNYVYQLGHHLYHVQNELLFWCTVKCGAQRRGAETAWALLDLLKHLRFPSSHARDFSEPQHIEHRYLEKMEEQVNSLVQKTWGEQSIQPSILLPTLLMTVAK